MAQYYYEKDRNEYIVYGTKLSGGRGQWFGTHSTKRAAMAQIDRLNMAALERGE